MQSNGAATVVNVSGDELTVRFEGGGEDGCFERSSIGTALLPGGYAKREPIKQRKPAYPPTETVPGAGASHKFFGTGQIVEAVGSSLTVRCGDGTEKRSAIRPAWARSCGSPTWTRCQWQLPSISVTKIGDWCGGSAGLSHDSGVCQPLQGIAVAGDGLHPEERQRRQAPEQREETLKMLPLPPQSVFVHCIQPVCRSERQEFDL